MNVVFVVVNEKTKKMFVCVLICPNSQKNINLD